MPTREEKIKNWVSDLEDPKRREKLLQRVVDSFGFDITNWGTVDTFIEMLCYAIHDLKEENRKLQDLIRGLDVRKLPKKGLDSYHS